MASVDQAPSVYTMIEAQSAAATVKDLAEMGVKTLPSIYVKNETDRPKVKYNDFTQEIPVIDLEGVSGQRRSEVVAEISKTCVEWGMFQVINHGVGKRLVDKMRADAFQFFQLPFEEKKAYAVRAGGEFLGYANGSILTDEKSMDWRELISLRIFPDRNEDQWPLKPPTFKETMEEFSASILELMKELLGLISESLGQESQALVKSCGEGEEKVVISFYPTCPQPDLTLGLKRHRDPGCIAVLVPNEVGGLQVTKDDGKTWVTVEPIEGALVVNLGDQLHVLSNGRYKSADHQAVVNSKATRMTIAVFYNPSSNCIVAPLPGLVDADNPVTLFEPCEYRLSHSNNLRSHMEKPVDNA